MIDSHSRIPTRTLIIVAAAAFVWNDSSGPVFVAIAACVAVRQLAVNWHGARWRRLWLTHATFLN